MDKRLDQGRDMTADEARASYERAVEKLKAAEHAMAEADEHNNESS